MNNIATQIKEEVLRVACKQCIKDLDIKVFPQSKEGFCDFCGRKDEIFAVRKDMY